MQGAGSGTTTPSIRARRSETFLLVVLEMTFLHLRPLVPHGIDLGLVPRNDAARLVRPLVAAGHDEPVLISRIVHEIFRFAEDIRVVIVPG